MDRMTIFAGLGEPWEAVYVEKTWIFEFSPFLRLSDASGSYEVLL